jgi:predicted DsbA family dithiol-disulfide isomerase
MRRIEVFAEIGCPFTYLGLERLIAARDAAGVDVHLRVRAWPLEWVNGAPLDPYEVEREVKALRDAVAPTTFAGFDPATFPRTSVPAFGLAAAAYLAGDMTGEAVSMALRRAVFEAGRDVSDPDVLREIGAPYGVAPLDMSAATAAVRCDWARGRARSVVGSPHFFAGDDDWFCPSLRIRHDASGYEVQRDAKSLEAFYERVLR